jgi:hypothetical protein
MKKEAVVNLGASHVSFPEGLWYTYIFNNGIMEPLPFLFVMYVILVVQLSSVGTKSSKELGFKILEGFRRGFTGKFCAIIKRVAMWMGGTFARLVLEALFALVSERRVL